MYNNLLKRGYGFFLNETEEKRVIETNELAARRLEELQAAVPKNAAAAVYQWAHSTQDD